MMKWRSIFSLIINLAIVLAQFDRSVMAQQINCYRLKEQIEFRNCIHLRYKAADKRLTEAYKQLIAKLNGEEKALLSEAQLEWIKQRDKTCEFEVYQNRGGTGYGVFLNHCLERMTKQRTAELEKYLQRQKRNRNRCKS
jgi:uncharacterized protein YecT (DUF1311 family)